MPKNRSALFRGGHFEDQVIILCVRWYLRHSLSYRDPRELLAERSLSVDHTTVGRWVQRYAPPPEPADPPRAAPPPPFLASRGDLGAGGRQALLAACFGPHARCHAQSHSWPSPYLNNIVEQFHRFIKKQIVAGLWFRSMNGARNTIAEYEAMHMIRKGQIRWLAKHGVVGQVAFIHKSFGIAA